MKFGMRKPSLKVNEPLVSFSNPETGESVEIHRSDVYSDDNPLYDEEWDKMLENL